MNIINSDLCKVATAKTLEKVLQERINWLAELGYIKVASPTRRSRKSSSEGDAGEEEEEEERGGKGERTDESASYPLVPRIYIPHIDFLTLEEQLVLKRVVEKFAKGVPLPNGNKKGKSQAHSGEMEREFYLTRLYATSCPFHGGFSMNSRMSLDGSSYYLFALARTKGAPLFDYVSGVIERILEDKHRIDYSKWVTAENISRAAVQTQQDVTTASSHQDIQEMVFDYCEKFMLLSFRNSKNGEVPHKSRTTVSKITSASTLRTHSINYYKIYGTDPMLSERWALLSCSTAMKLTPIDPQQVKAAAISNIFPPYVSPPSQELMQTGLLMAHMSVPNYKAIEAYEVLGRPCQAVPIDLPLDKLLTLPPIVLLNILIRHRRKTIQFIGKQDDWESYKDYWHRATTIQGFMTTQTRPTLSMSIPIDAVLLWNKTTEDIEEQIKLRNATTALSATNEEVLAFTPPPSSLVRRRESSVAATTTTTTTTTTTPLRARRPSVTIDLEEEGAGKENESTRDAWGTTNDQMSPPPSRMNSSFSFFDTVTRSQREGESRNSFLAPLPTTAGTNKKQKSRSLSGSRSLHNSSSSSSQDGFALVDESSRMSDSNVFY